MMDTSAYRLRSTLLTRAAALGLMTMVAAMSTACAADPTAPTPSPLPQSLEVYTGVLSPGGSVSRFVSLNSQTSMQVMFAGAVTGSPKRSVSPTLRLELQAWDGSQCVEKYVNDTAPRMTAALHAYLDQGSYCVALSDPLGSLTEPVEFVLRVAAPALIRTGLDGGTAEFTSTVIPGGTTDRTFLASQQGQVALTLTGLSAGDTEVGLGLGVMANDGGGCRLTQIVYTRPGTSPQLTTRVDAGSYCAMVFDTGNLVRPETFTMTIVYP
jgi:hypothetical protein